MVSPEERALQIVLSRATKNLIADAMHADSISIDAMTEELYSVARMHSLTIDELRSELIALILVENDAQSVITDMYIPDALYDELYARDMFDHYILVAPGKTYTLIRPDDAIWIVLVFPDRDE